MAGYSGTSEPAALAVASIVCSDWDRAKLDFQFVDMTAASGLDALNGVVLGAAFVDLDQGGDLDLIAARYSDSPTSALKALQDENAANHSPNLNSCLERFWRSLVKNAWTG